MSDFTQFSWYIKTDFVRMCLVYVSRGARERKQIDLKVSRNRIIGTTKLYKKTFKFFKFSRKLFKLFIICNSLSDNILNIFML